MKHILSYIRKAVEDYNMIEDGDKIAVALSGGKDSITMLKGLKSLQYFYPKKFELIAISVNPGFDFFDSDFLRKTCDELDIPFFEEKYDIKQIVFDDRKEKNPCSLCANLRRGILSSAAKRENCTKIALGHNLDDVIETFLMNLFFAGSISTFSPVTYMNRSNLTVIRPLVYAPEKETKRFIKRSGTEIMPKVCPMDGNSTREYIKQLIVTLSVKNPHIKAGIIGAIKRNNINGWKE
ncbi:MAG: tRNA 2-thiocytidine biosynthesis TtcA family protein [Clostridia bacterium]